MRDIHRETASEMFGVSVEKVTEEMRRGAKMLNFARIYGGLVSTDMDILEVKMKREVVLDFLKWVKGKGLIICEDNNDAESDQDLIPTFLKDDELVDGYLLK